MTWLNLGTVDLQSEPGKGSAFAFTLPAFDLRRILACFIRNIRPIEDAGDLWMLRIRSTDETTDASRLRRMVSSCCYPMDLVLPGANGPTAHALGICSDANAWMNRLRRSMARFDLPDAPQGSDMLDIKVEGPWSRDRDSTRLIEDLTTAAGLLPEHS
jgi:hypothetical protein